MATWSNWSGSVDFKTRAHRAAENLSPNLPASCSQPEKSASSAPATPSCRSAKPTARCSRCLISKATSPSTPRPIASAAPAGCSLDKLTEVLWEKGYSLINQGDVNPQALAGAIGTGTHGTGAKLGTLSTAARAFELMTPDGAIVRASPTENPDLFEAARLSLGLVGVATRIEIDVLPAYHLEERLEVYPLARNLRTLGTARGREPSRRVLRLPLCRPRHAEDPRSQAVRGRDEGNSRTWTMSPSARSATSARPSPS